MHRLLLPLLLCANGCALFLPAPEPMRALTYRASTPEPRCRLLLLPGMGDAAETFERESFVRLLRTHLPDVEVVSADATSGYYFRGTLPQRLQQDVVGPVQAERPAPLWVLGISMGGLGSLMHARGHTEQVQGLILIAPYLGPEGTLRAIRESGGLARWQPRQEAPLEERNYPEQLWGWLKRHTGEAYGQPIILLGYGTEDRLAPANALLGAALPAQNVRTVPGKHHWPTWRVLLEHFLQHPDFVSRCGPSA
jgi:hypothetical protein